MVFLSILLYCHQFFAQNRGKLSSVSVFVRIHIFLWKYFQTGSQKRWDTFKIIKKYYCNENINYYLFILIFFQISTGYKTKKKIGHLAKAMAYAQGTKSGPSGKIALNHAQHNWAFHNCTT